MAGCERKKEIFLSLNYKWFLLTLNIWFSKSTLNESGLFSFPTKMGQNLFFSFQRSIMLSFLIIIRFFVECKRVAGNLMLQVEPFLLPHTHGRSLVVVEQTHTTPTFNMPHAQSCTHEKNIFNIIIRL